MMLRMVVLPVIDPIVDARSFGAGLQREGQAFELLSFGATEHEAEANAVAVLAHALLKEYASADQPTQNEAIGHMRDALNIKPHIVSAAVIRAERMAEGGDDTAALVFDTLDRQELALAVRRWRDTAAVLHAVAASTPNPTQEITP